MQDEENFSDFLDGVKPLKQSDTIPERHRQIAQDLALARQKAATNTKDEKQSRLSADKEVALVDPHDMLEFQRAGVQHGVYRKLRLGQYDTDTKLDLHHHTMAEAKEALLKFIDKCKDQQVRSAIIIHGLGLKSQPPAKLKSCINTWLRELPEVMAFHSCQKMDGGLGAVYILLAKSAEAKQKNRERFQQRHI